MLRFRLQQLLSDRQFATGQRMTLTELAVVTGVNRVTLSRMANVRGYNTVTDNLDRLCTFFGCKIEQLVEHVPESELPKEVAAKESPPPKRVRKSNAPKARGGRG
jgi:DNA-binding Xre family transcriptional regulator